MGFFRKVIGAVTKPLQKLGPVGDIATAIALTAAGQPELIPLVTGAKTYGSGGTIGQSLLSAGASYAGGKIGASLFPGNVASATGVGALPWSGASNTFGNTIGDIIGRGTASEIGQTSIGSIIGSKAGEGIAKNFAGNVSPNDLPVTPPTGPEPFKPKQEGAQDLPSGLTSSLGSLTPQQLSTNIATQGVYGGGAGPKETSYFLNQANRRLVDEGGNVSANTGSFAPIELSFLNQLGLGTGNPSNILEAISKWRTQNPAYA